MANLSSIFGSQTDPKFYIPGITKLFLLEKARISGISGNTDNTEVSAITCASGATFQEIIFEADSASYSQEFVTSTSAKYINQTLNFRVESDSLTQAHQILLNKDFVALVKDKSGKWLMLGQSNGLNASAGTKNGTDEDSNLSFTLIGKNLGFGAKITLTDTALRAIVNGTI